MAAVNRQWLLRSRPIGEVADADLELREAALPEALGDGQVLVRNLYISIDPTHRIWMSDRPQYMMPVQLGEVMRAMTVGVVEKSNFPDLSEGDFVFGSGGVQAYYVSEGAALSKTDPSLPLPDQLGPYSVIIGLTAFYGTHYICKPKAGETFVVSAAAGAVGSMVGQLAKIAGCRVIGSVGSEAKAKWITEELGFDGAINYKTDDIEAKLRELAPNGVDCFFDNTSGAILDAVFAVANNYARVCVCGLIDQYNVDSYGPRNFNMMLMRRMTIRGFICTDHLAHMGEMLEAVRGHVAAGRLKYKLDVREGLENYVKVVRLLFSGENEGKLMLKV